jgi:ribosomal protein S11
MKKLPIGNRHGTLGRSVAVAQEGAPAGAPKKSAAPAAAQDAAKPAALDAAAEAWVKTLAAKIADGSTARSRDSSSPRSRRGRQAAVPVLNAMATGTGQGSRRRGEETRRAHREGSERATIAAA